LVVGESGEYLLITGGGFICVAYAPGHCEKPRRTRAKALTEAQLGYVTWCYDRGVTHKGNKLQAKTAEVLMTLVGTQAFKQKFAHGETDQYPVTDGKPWFRVHEQLDHWKIKPFFSQQKAAFQDKMIKQRELAKLVAEHGPAAAWLQATIPEIQTEMRRRQMDNPKQQKAEKKAEYALRLLAVVKAELAERALLAGGAQFLVEDEGEFEE
jgi:hypothetical protein